MQHLWRPFAAARLKQRVTGDRLSIMSVEIPSSVPVMTLSGVTLFPHAVTPLFIFEPRYRKMLADVLASHRMLCIAGQDNELAADSGLFEPPFAVASVGVIRASRQNEDETSHLVVQGVTRVRVAEILQEDPYRIALIEPLTTSPGAGEDELFNLRHEMITLLRAQRKLRDDLPTEAIDFVESVEDVEPCIDMSIATFCREDSQRQALLEELNTFSRVHTFNRFLRKEIERLRLDRRLRDGLGGADPSVN